MPRANKKKDKHEKCEEEAAEYVLAGNFHW